MRLIFLKIFTALAATGSTFNVLAQTTNEDSVGLFTKVDTIVSHDDNIYRVTEEISKSDSFVTISPEIKFRGGLGKHRVEAKYSGEYAKYNKESTADFLDHDFTGKINFEHTLRFNTRLEAGYKRDHEEPGTINRIQLDITEYNKFNQSYYLLGLGYGQDSSIGRLSVNYRRNKKNYINNNLNFLDYVGDQFTATFTYRVAPKTKLYIDGLYSELDYEPSVNFELDNTFKRYRAGITWNFTNKLSGDINIGYQDRNYHQITLQDITGLAYSGKVSWSINTYTKFVVEASREAVDSSLQNAGGSLRSSYNIGIAHELTELLSIKADVAHINDELAFSVGREDERYAYDLGLEYFLSRNMKLSADYTYEQRNSTNVLAEFNANIISLSATILLDN
jgi:opacity protein-like surface antigen